ncbi:hypothetical protein [Streptomyces botrytidirepellens]|uniref:Uncharacterized protein n=1 Tax=Streptomyces botrytidirepellens TaxID=2486417 RepID=A0A3M8WWQ8_9ACTN|nr:hypothetical protein [Streptomyces botrytidirepellens]RNG33490.1 hypothetical protein EEJ42_07520 [Streptomyces botrytidirepellens]
MSAQEPTALDDPRRDDRSPSMRDLLAACAAASAVSTPPEAPVEAEAQQRPADEPERDAA